MSRRPNGHAAAAAGVTASAAAPARAANRSPANAAAAASSSSSAAASPSPDSAYPTVVGPYSIGGLIGQGIFAPVMVGMDEFRQKVAVKVFNKNDIKAKSGASGSAVGATPMHAHQLAQIEKEINSLRTCTHPHIAQFYDVLETEQNVLLIMEYLPYGELYDHILQKGKLPEAEAGRLFGQVVSAVEHCHQRGIVHRDLKPENILLTEKGDLKLVDFGLANYFDVTQSPHVRSLRTQCGSPHYASPEVLTGNRYSGVLSDCWSLGILLYAMLCGTLPFNAKSIPQLIKKIVEGKFKLPKFLSPQAQHLLQSILQIVPENRPTLQTIQEHPWMVMYRSLLPGSEPASAAGSRPLSRPEIISPQSYTNAKGAELMMLAAKKAGVSYLTANANDLDAVGVEAVSEGEEEEEEDDDAEAEHDGDEKESEHDEASRRTAAHHAVSASASASPAAPSAAAQKFAAAKARLAKASAAAVTLPPSSVLSFKDSGVLGSAAAGEGKEDEDDDAFGPTAHEPAFSTGSGRAIPRASTDSSSLGGVGHRPTDSDWSSTANSTLSSPSHAVPSKAPLTCPSCGKSLSLRTEAGSGRVVLSGSLARGASFVPGAEELCQCGAPGSTSSAGAKSYSADVVQRDDSPALSSSAAAAAASRKRSSPSKSHQPASPPPSDAELLEREKAYKARVAALFRAAETGDVVELGKLISPVEEDPLGVMAAAAATLSAPAPLGPVDVRVTSIDSWNALHYSARGGHAGCVTMLLTCWQALDINARTRAGWTALMLAADQGHGGVVDVLLRYGAAIHVTNAEGKSAIFLARESGHTGLATQLTAASSVRHVRHAQQSVVEHAHAADPSSQEEPTQEVRELNHEFFRAAECGDLGKVKHLLLLGSAASASAASEAAATPAVPAPSRRSGAPPVVDPKNAPRFLVDILARGIDRWTVLHFAARKGRVQVVELLLDHSPPADLNAVTKNGWSALMLAADRGHTETCKLLLQRGADPNLVSNDKYTALSVAREGNAKDIVALLAPVTLSAAASPSASAAADLRSRTKLASTPVTSPAAKR